MTAASDPPTALGKRTVEEAELEEEGPVQVVGDTKRRRITADKNGSQKETQSEQEVQKLQDNARPSSANTECYNTRLSEDPPQTWTSQQLDHLFKDLEMQTEPTTQLELDVQDEQALQQNLQLVSDWTKDQTITEQESGVDEQLTAQGLEHWNIENEDKRVVFDTAKQPEAVNAILPQRLTQSPGYGFEDAQNRTPEKRQESAQVLSTNPLPTHSAVQNDEIPNAVLRVRACHSEESVERSSQILDQTAEEQQPGVSLSALPAISQTGEVACLSQPQELAQTSPSEHHRDQCRQELNKQDVVLELLLSAPGCNQQSVLQKRMKEVWVAKARQFEGDFISKFVVEVSDMDFRSTAKSDILVRQGELIKRAFFQNKPQSPVAKSQERASHRARMLATLKRKQLSTLRYWTAEWEEELSDKGLGVSRRNSPTGVVSLEEASRMNRSDGSTVGPSVLPTSIEQRSQTAAFQDKYGSQQGPVSCGETHVNEQQESSPPSSKRWESFHADHGQHQIAGYFDFQSESPNFTRPYPAQATHEVLHNQYSPSPSREAPLVLSYSANSEPRPIIYPSNSFLPPPDAILPPNPFLNSWNATAPKTIYPQHASVLAMSGRSNPSTAMGPKNRKRGAPRTRMFIASHRTSVPLSVRAQTDDEEVLRTFPEHLSIPGVMQCFVRQPRSQSGGWPTQRMVDFLESHPNAKDFQGITRAQRRDNLKRWVIKERDMCNNHQRKAAGIRQGIVSNSPRNMLQSPYVTAPQPSQPSQPSEEPVMTPIQTLPRLERANQIPAARVSKNDGRERVVGSAFGINDFQAHWQNMDPLFLNVAHAPPMQAEQTRWQEGTTQSPWPAGRNINEPNESNFTRQIDDEDWEAFFDFRG